MNLARSKASWLLVTLVALLLAAGSALAADYTLTGSGTRVKTVAFIDVNVYSISHFMRELPSSRSKQAVIDKETDKKFVWKMLRDVDHAKIVDALKDAYAMNGYSDSAKIGQLMGAFKSELKETSSVTISYDAAKQATTVTVSGGGSATVPGVDFMKATWSIWFGKIDQPRLGDQLVSKIP